MEQRVLVCGGRDFDNFPLMVEILEAAHAANTIVLLISGMARGADNMGAIWAANRGIVIAPFHADWKRDGKAAGPIRNQRMLDEGKPHLVIAFPGGRGTADMIKRAEKAGVPVARVTPPVSSNK